MSAEPGRPPLSKRFKERALIRLDWAVAAVCAVLVYAVMVRSGAVYIFPLSIRLVGAWIPLVLAGCSVIVAVGGEISRGPSLPLALVLFTLAATCKRRVAVAGLIASLALLVVQGLIMSFTGRGSGPAATGVALILIIVWMIGLSVQQRRAYTARVREQVATAAVTEERLRIARELHDVVAHSMTVVAVQAGFGEYVFYREPGQAREALGAIQHVTREALADMQRLLGVLRQDGTGQPAGSQARTGGPADGQEPVRQLQLAPAPGLADLDRLVSTTAGAGVRVNVTKTGEHRDIPAMIDQSAFRIVQEALTNVVKHSGADSCWVSVAHQDASLSVEITDHGAGPAAGRDWSLPARGPNGTGHGILGMRERVSLSGGEFTAGPLPERGFRVAARFPLPAQAPRQQALPRQAISGPAR